jgi:hypothetical protein
MGKPAPPEGRSQDPALRRHPVPEELLTVSKLADATRPLNTVAYLFGGYDTCRSELVSMAGSCAKSHPSGKACCARKKGISLSRAYEEILVENLQAYDTHLRERADAGPGGSSTAKNYIRPFERLTRNIHGRSVLRS